MKAFLLTVFLVITSALNSQNINKLLREVGNSIYSGDYEKALNAALLADSLIQEDYDIESPEYCEFLSQIGLIYSYLDQYDVAITYYQKSLESFRDYTDIEDEPAYISALNGYAAMLVYIERYADAEPLLDEALQIQKDISGEQSGEYALSLSTLGNLQASKGNYSDAESNLLKAIDIWKIKVGEFEGDYANALYSLAELYYDREQYKSALSLYLDVTKKYKKIWGEKDSSYAISLADLGDVYVDLSEFDKALSSYQKAIEIIRVANGEESENYADCIYRLANYHREKGDFSEAEQLYKQALDIQNERGYDNENTLYSLSALYQITGNFSASEKLCLEVLKIDEKSGKGSADYLAAQNLLANHYTLIGSYEKALVLYKDIVEKSRISFGERNPVYATYLDNLANLYRNMGEYKLVEPVALEAMEIKKATFGEFSPEVAYSLQNLADAYEFSGDIEKAEIYCKRIVEIYLKTFGEDNYEYAGSLSALASIYLLDEKYSEAEQLYIKAATIIKKQLGEKHPGYANVLSNMTEILELTGRSDEAEPLWLEINSNLNNQIIRNFSFLAEKEKEQFISSISSSFEEMNSFIHRRKEINPSITTISYDNELALKGIVLQSSKAIRQIALNSNNDELIELYDTYFRKNQLLLKINQMAPDQRWLNSDSLEAVCNDLEKELAGRIRLLNGSQDLSGIGNQLTWLDVQSSLGPKDAAIEFVSFYYNNLEDSKDSSTYYCALVLRPDMIQPAMIFLFKEDELINLLEKTKSPNDQTTASRLYKMPDLTGEQDSDIENTLYKLIWKPIEILFSGVEKIYYSPAGLLNRISFDAIPLDDKSYLSDKYMMVAVSTTRSIVKKLEEGANTSFVKEPVVYGGINYDSDTVTMKSMATRYGTINRSQNVQFLPGEQSRGGGFDYLEGTQQEVLKIKDILDDFNIKTYAITGNDATEESFKALNNLNSPPFIHIATHGFFFPDPSRTNNNLEAKKSSLSGQFKISDNPLLRSGLIFAGANHAWRNQPIPADVEDGILLASEVSQMYLPNTQLVVLSACETGLGDIKGSEGVFGLQRAFKMAGVKYLLISLWQVPDYQTAELMGKFYGYWLSGSLIHESFREAQLFLKNKYPDNPYNWAAFVLIE